MKKLQIILMMSFIISSFASLECTTQSIIFGFYVTPAIDQYDKEIWQRAKEIVNAYNKSRSENSNLTMQFLNDGLSAVDNLFTVVSQTSSIQAKILINIDPVTVKNQKLHEILFIKFCIDQKDCDQTTWKLLDEQTKMLISYCKNSGEKEFDFDYFCSEVKGVFKQFLTN